MMHHPLMILFTALLFFVLTPGILLTLPAHGSLATKAMVHAFVFALVYHFTHHAAYAMLGAGREGASKTLSCPEGQHKDKDGKCVEA